MYLEMSVFGFTIDSLANRPVVILKDAIGNNTVPIWLNAGEALSIAAELILWDSTARSGRKDLMTLLMDNMGTQIGSIAIEGGNNGVFTASVRFMQNGEELSVAVRPCEAIIAALKFKMPIMMAEEVLQREPLEIQDAPPSVTGAPQKALYLSADHWRQAGILPGHCTR